MKKEQVCRFFSSFRTFLFYFRKKCFMKECVSFGVLRLGFVGFSLGEGFELDWIGLDRGIYVSYG